MNILTAAIGCLTLVSYIFVYTPLKQRTIANTWFGGITGALPPVMGWTAACNELNWEVIPIFALLYFWQLPHFFAIAWMYRQDYERSGFKMLSVVDHSGQRTAVQMLLNVFLLIVSSISIYVIGQGSLLYLISSFFLGLWFLLEIFYFWIERSIANSRKVIQTSIIYLLVLINILIFEQFF